MLNHSIHLVCDQWVIISVKPAPGGASVPSQVRFGPDLVKSLTRSNQSGPKLKQFAAITPHLLLLIHSMPLVCDQWVMFCCETSSYGGASVPSQVSFGARSGQKFGNVQPIWAQLEAQFAAITPHLLLLNHSMPLVCDQWVMFCRESSSWWSICAKSSQFWGQIWSKD
jgi:hypothetical protein